MSFDSLNLSDALVRALHKKGYDSPTPIQEQAIPAVLAGRDLLAAAQTGTGKTAGFTLPLLQKFTDEPKQRKKHGVRALIMTPTRELAIQVGESVKTYGAHLHLRSTVVYGGVKINAQIGRLQGGVDILVATPGRLLDLKDHKAVNLSQVEVLVLDEADRMLDMGFIHDIRKILKLLPQKRQNLLFSATFSKGIRDLTRGLLNDPLSIDIAPRNTTAENVEQTIYQVDKARKPELLGHLIKDGDWEQVLVFTRTKHGANRLSDRLERYDISSAAIHGNKSQNARVRALADFKAGNIKVLVATDIAARGLDIVQLPHVVNFELPNVPEDYVHRIGRTGRAGASGHAISFVCGEENKLVKGIERLLNKRLSVSKTPIFKAPAMKPAVKKPTPTSGRPSGGPARRKPRPKSPNKPGQVTRNHRPRRPRKKS